MASNKTIDIETFFQAVSSAGSVDELKTIVLDLGPEERNRIANSFNSKGETPLIVAIKRNHNAMVRYLVSDLKANISQLGRFIWEGLVFKQVPPIFVAVVCGTDIAEPITKFLMDQDLASSSKPGYVDAIMSSSLNQTQKRNVLKLLGAVYILEDEKSGKSFAFGLILWRKAIHLDGHSTIPATPLTIQETELARKVFGNVSEFSTLRELEEICNSHSSHNIHIQALFIIKRVMNEIHPHPLPYLSFALLRYGRLLVLDSYLFSHAIDFGMLAVEPLRTPEWNDALNSDWSFTVVEKFLDILWFRLHYQKEMNLPLGSPNRVHFPVIIEAFRCFSHFHSKLLIRHGATSQESAQLVFVQMNCIKELPLLNLEESEEFKQWLSGYIGVVECHPRMFTLLHAVCHCHPQDNNTIQLLLNAGACPIATDKYGNSPLLLLSLARSFNGTAVQLLLDAGAHLDQANDEGITPLNMLKRVQLIIAKQNLAPDPYLHSLCDTFFPLQCLCAQVIRKHRIPFEHLPPVLKSFVEKH